MHMKAKLLPVHINCQPNSGHLIPLGIDPRRRAGAVPTDTASSASKSVPGKKAEKCKRTKSWHTDKNIKAVLQVDSRACDSTLKNNFYRIKKNPAEAPAHAFFLYT